MLISCRGAAIGAWVLVDCFALGKEEVGSEELARVMARHSVLEVVYCVADGFMHARPLWRRRAGAQVRWDQLFHHAACAAGFAAYLALQARFRSGPAPALTSLLLLQHASTPLLHASWLMEAFLQGRPAARAGTALRVVLAAVFVAVRVLGWPVLFAAYASARASRPNLPEPRWHCYAASLAMLALNLVWVRAGAARLLGTVPRGSSSEKSR